METANVTIRHLARDEIPLVEDLCLAENFPQTHGYLELCYDVYPSGYFAAFSPNGVIISHCGGVIIDDSMGFIAFYVTRTGYRRKGIGRKVFNKTLTALGNRNIGLNSATGKESMYMASGFAFQPFQLLHYVTIPSRKVTNCSMSGVSIVDGLTLRFEDIEKYEEGLYPFSRSGFLRKWLEFNAKSRIALMDGRVVGYGCMRPGTVGFRVMPLYANDLDIAKMIWDSLLVDAPDDCPITVGIPKQNENAVKLMQDLGMDPSKTVSISRMYTKPTQDTDLTRVYSVMNYDCVLF